MKLQYVGADPELCLRDKATGRFASAWGVIPGTKEEPLKVKNGAVQRDGMLAEFNIDPAASVNEFVDNIKSVMAQLRDMAPNHELCIEPMATFDDDVWDNTPYAAKILGCDPDYNAYTGRANPPPPNTSQERSAAGHVHLGWTEGMDITNPGHFQACQILAKELDLTMAYPLQLLEKDQGSIRRRQLYGRPGAFRPKPYGMEYRVPSNFWLASEELMEWVYNTCHNTFKNLMEGNALHQDDEPSIVVRDCLLEGNRRTHFYHHCLNKGIIQGGLKL